MTPGIVVGHLPSRDPCRWRCADKRSYVLVGAQRLYNNGDSGWIAPTFAGTWANAGGSFAPAAYRKQGNIVRLRGAINGGASNTTAFTLPAGFNPLATLGFQNLSYNQTSNISGNGGLLSISSAGLVGPVYPVGTTHVFLDGITFTTD